MQLDVTARMRPDDPGGLQATADALAEELDVVLGGIGELVGYELDFERHELLLLVDAEDDERVRSALGVAIAASGAFDGVEGLS